jgi:arginyl-tRNA synthetase
MNIFKELRSDLERCCFQICTDSEIWSHATLESPKDQLNGDISTNIAMLIAAKNGGNPREIAIKFKESLNNIPYIAHIEVAGPGFINFTIKAEKWYESIKSIINDDKEFWCSDIGKGEKVNEADLMRILCGDNATKAE